MMKIPFLRWLDRMIGFIDIPIIWLFSFPFPKAKLQTRRILIIKLWALGESILTLPLIRAIKKKYPGTHIDVLVLKRSQEVYTGNKDIADIKRANPLTILKNLRKYDIVIDCEPYLNASAVLAWLLGKRRIGFSHSARALLYTDRIPFDDQKHEMLAFMDLAKPLGIIELPERLVPVATSRQDEKKVNALFNEFGLKKNDAIVCINPGAAESSKGRMWPAENFAKVADALVKEFLVKIVLTGAKSERADAEAVMNRMHYNAINAAGETSVKELAAFLKRCALVISNDTGPMHLAAAMGSSTLGLFCPNTPVRFAPYGPGNEFIYKPVLPKPCINVHKGQVPDCRNHKHMSLITVEDVLQKARRMLYARRH
jgi:heptosyltransferase-2